MPVRQEQESTSKFVLMRAPLLLYSHVKANVTHLLGEQGIDNLPAPCGLCEFDKKHLSTIQHAILDRCAHIQNQDPFQGH